MPEPLYRAFLRSAWSWRVPCLTRQKRNLEKLTVPSSFQWQITWILLSGRIQNGEQISNPLTDDIRVMFYKEYKVASCIGELLKERLQIEIDEHEIGYLALHVHSAIVEENVSQAMEVARAVRESISLVEHITGHTIDVMSLSYNRMMNHIRYMVARAVSGEKLKVNMNDYMSVKFPEAFRAAKRICEEMEKRLKLPMEEIEIGYLAMHIERIMDREEGE